MNAKFLAATSCAAAVMIASAAALGEQRPGADDRRLFTRAELAAIYSHSPLGEPPSDAAVGARALRLGQALFFERWFSADGSVSCATCHAPEKAFADGRRVGVGLESGERNTPSLLNAAFNRWFFWDGRADTLWAQALGPIENAKEFGGDRLNTVHVLAENQPLRRAYEEVFGPLPPVEDARRFPRHGFPDSDPRSPAAVAWAGMAPADQDAINEAFANLGKAIEAYERKLVSGDSPFDRYVAALKSGDHAGQHAYPATAKRGLKLFVGAGQCELCHSGPAFSDGAFHNLGLPVQAGGAADTGRAAGIGAVRASAFNATGPYSDSSIGEAKDQLMYLPPPQSQLGAFKTPGLRNVALTGPYMHDGRFDTLEAVLEFYGKGGAKSRGQKLVGKREATLDLIPHLSAGRVADLVAFLKTLNGAPLPAELTHATSEP